MGLKTQVPENSNLLSKKGILHFFEERSEWNHQLGFSLEWKRKLVFPSLYEPHDTGWILLKWCFCYVTIIMLKLLGVWITLMKTMYFGANSTLEYMCSGTHYVLINTIIFICDQLPNFGRTNLEVYSDSRKLRSGWFGFWYWKPRSERGEQPNDRLYHNQRSYLLHKV